MNGMYQRNSNEAFENAKLKGLDKPNEVMYMYSLENFDYFKNINFRNYTRFPISLNQMKILYQLMMIIINLIKKINCHNLAIKL